MNSFLLKLKEPIILLNVLIFTLVCFYFASSHVLFKEFTPYPLSQTTLSLLEQFHKTIEVTLQSQNVDTVHHVKMLIERYQHIQPLIKFNWQQKDSLDLPPNSVVITHENAKQVVDLEKYQFDENQFTQALFRLQRRSNQWIVFLQGHGEGDPFGHSNLDLSLFRLALENQGLKVARLNLSQTPYIPDNTSVLVIASPKYALSLQEESKILHFLSQGKEILWLTDPSSVPISSLAKALGITLLPGTIVDSHGEKLGLKERNITIINHYPDLPFEAPRALSVFPMAQALKKHDNTDFNMNTLLLTHEQTWTASTSSFGKLDLSEQELAGPFLLGVILTRNLNNNEKQQRIAIIGNSQFLSNGTLENFGNLSLGLSLMNWLNHDDKLLSIAYPVIKDTMLTLSLWSALLIQYGFFLISLFLLIFSIIYSIKRYHRQPSL